ncbi:MAG: STT3 domain-containing protein [Nanoarchaeota archaeon]
MENNVLIKRKEDIVDFLKKNINYLQYLLLAIIVYIGVYVRSRNLELLKDVTTGKYISLELDSTIFLRYAREIAEHGTLYAKDMLRSYPFGSDISNLGIFTSYFVAYLYKFLHLFSNTITLEYANNIYPVLAMAILTVFLFLLLRRLFNYRVGLVAATILNVIPAFLFRSMAGSSDHDILGMMLIFMTFYFYVVAWQSKKIKYNIIFGAVAGITTGLALFTAGSSSFIFVVIGIFSIIELFLNKFTKHDYYSFLSWLIISSIILEAKSRVALFVLFFSVSTGTAYMALLVATINHFLFKRDYLKKYREKYHNILSKTPEGITSFIISLVIGLILSLIIAGPKFIIAKFSELSQTLFKSFSVTRWVQTVAENKTPYVTDWFSAYGTWFVYAFIIGSIIVFYYAVKSLKSAKILTTAYAVFIFSYIFSRFSASSFLNGESTIAKFLFFGSLLFFFLFVTIGYLTMYYKKHNDFENISKIDKNYTYVIVWFIVFIFPATSAIRFLFEFSTITSILVAVLIVAIFDFFWNREQTSYKIVAVVVLLLILFSPLSFAPGIVSANYDRSLGQSMYSGPGYNQQWQHAGKWARENTPKDAGFIHWWDYGYWVQEGFQRATVTDGGNFFGWWNYLTARYVLTAQRDDESLKFLKTHNVSYFLAISDDIGKYPAYSSIGSDENKDRYSYISTFFLNEQLTEERRNYTLLTYTGGQALDEDLIIDGKVLPAGASGIAAMMIPVKISQDGKSIEGVNQPTAVLGYQGQRYDLPIRCVYLLDKYYEFQDYKLDSCIRIIPVINSDNTVNQIGAGIVLTKKTGNSLFARLYILNQQSKYFSLVYDDSNMIPLSFYNGRLIGPIKIWKVNYPDDIKITEEDYNYYTRTDYPNIELTKPI